MVPMSYDYLEGFEKIEIDPKKLLTNIKIKNVFYFSHNPKVVSSSLTPATTNFIRVARDCGLFIFAHFKLHKMNWAPFGHKSM